MLPTISANINLYPQYNANVLDDFLNSLDVLGRLDIGLILPGHGEPFIGLKTWIEERIQYHKQRNSEILERLKAGARTAYQISAEMTSTVEKGEVSWQNLGIFDRRRAILETLAHLESLRASGKVDKSSGDGIIYYQRA